MAYCGSDCLVKYLDRDRHAVTLKCRSWGCEDCAPIRKKQLIRQAHAGRPNTFITLTIRRDLANTPNEAALTISHAWRLVRLRAIREAKRDPSKTPTPMGSAPPDGWKRDTKGRVPRMVELTDGRLPFLAVIEAHVSGWPHLHVLARSTWIDHRWLSAQMLDLLGSPVVWIERITQRSKHKAYVAKYCSKATHKFGNAKRYWCSRDYALSPWLAKRIRSPDEPRWERAGMPLAQWAAIWRLFGWTVETPQTGEAYARAPPA